MSTPEQPVTPTDEARLRAFLTPAAHTNPSPDFLARLQAGVVTEAQLIQAEKRAAQEREGS